MTFVEMDERWSVASQMTDNVRPLIVINKFTVEPDDADQLVKAWATDAAWMKQQPGFISTQLHRGIGGSGVFVNYAVWESTEHFRGAFMDPAFRSRLAQYPSSTVVSPHLFRKVAVAGICADDSGSVSPSGIAPR